MHISTRDRNCLWQVIKLWFKDLLAVQEAVERGVAGEEAGPVHEEVGIIDRRRRLACGLLRRLLDQLLAAYLW